MSLSKGLAFSAVGALAGAVLWIVVIRLSGWSLWVLAPIVGGAAGFGMMKATQMKGGAPAGALAAVITLVAIFGARYFVVSEIVHEHLAMSGEEAYGVLTEEIARDMAAEGQEVFDDEGEYTNKVQRRAYDTWMEMSEEDRHKFIASRQGETDAAASVLTPLGLLFDFGIFGTICAVLAAGTAFKTGSMRLEDALVEKGLAEVGGAEALAEHLRAGGKVDSAPAQAVTAKTLETTPRPASAGIWSVPLKPAEEKPLPRIKVVSRDDAPTESPKDPPSDGAKEAA